MPSSLIGALANLAVAGIAKRHGATFATGTDARHAFGLLRSVGVSWVYFWIRYL